MKDKQEIIDAVLDDFDGRIYKMRHQLQSDISRAWNAGSDTRDLDWKRNHELLDELKQKEYDSGFQAGYVNGLAHGARGKMMAEDAAYQRGLDDAWAAVEKIALHTSDGGFSVEELSSVFGLYSPSDVIKQFSPWVAVSKIREYEERKKTPAEPEICDQCKYESNDPDDRPCISCKHNYMNCFQPKEPSNGF